MTAATPLNESIHDVTSSSIHAPRRVTIGILALQGAFAEHSAVLARLGADVREVRLPEEFDGLDGIILPGGESTAMALIGERWGIFPRLKLWVSEGRPVWGTCAGMILLSDTALMTKQGGQSLVGGLNVEICRNYFGAQKSSFEIPLDTSKLGLENAVKKGDATAANYSGPYPAVFIRAPAVLEVGPGVDVLCTVRARSCQKAVTVMRALLKAQEGEAAQEVGGERDVALNPEDAPAAKRRRLASFFAEPSRTAAGENVSEQAPEVIVALRKGNVVATAFHPELTNDSRWHEYFVGIVRQAVQNAEGGKVSKVTAGVEAVVVEAVVGESVSA